MHPFARAVPLLRSTALAAALLALAACNTTRSTETTGSIGLAGNNAPRTEAEWRSAADSWGERYRRDQKDTQAAINYAQALRATAQRAQAVAVLEQASIANPHEKALLGAYGRALADVGRYDQALDVLERAHSPDQPDWRIVNVQGAVLDQMGRHEEARRQYMSALRMKPEEASVLSNLGLSYALTNDLKNAEQALRRAAGQSGAAPKVKQNLALVIGLQGRMNEAEAIARESSSREEAEANVAYLREMLAQHKGWSGTESKAAAAAVAPRSKKKPRANVPAPDADAGT
jgi:Flp pilus assembly protein TadD